MQDVIWKNEYANLIVLSARDESESYKLDQSLIGLNKQTGKFGLMLAGGGCCCCWEGEAQIEYFDSLEDMEKELPSIEDNFKYYRSIKKSNEMLTQAKEQFKKYCEVAFKNET